MAKGFKFRPQAWVRAYFGFSRTETNAFLILLPLLSVVLLSEPLYRHWRISRPLDFSKDTRELDSIIARMQWDTPDSLKSPEVPTFQFSVFDPNTASLDKLTGLGLNAPLAKRLIRYREKGGVFKRKDDLLRIYGFDSAWYKQAKAWIHIPQPLQSKPVAPKQRTPVKPVQIDINLADSLQLLSVYGIGPTLSKRIRTYRDRLGGFIAMEQLMEVYGLDSVVVGKLKEKFFIAGDFQPQKLNLNTVTQETFRHPYIRWKEAKAILAYRLQHKTFQSLDQLKEIEILSAEWLNKIRPYLSVE